MLNGTDAVAPPGEWGNACESLSKQGNTQEIQELAGNWLIYVGCPLISLSPRPTLSWLTAGCLATIPFFVWPKLSKVNLNKEFHWRPPRNTYLPEKTVLVMQEMANFPLSQSWIGPAGWEEVGWSYRADSNRDTRAFPIQPGFRFKKGCQCLVQPTSQNVHLMSV